MPNYLLSFCFSSISPFGTLLVARLNFALNLASPVVFKKLPDWIHSMLIPSISFKKLLFVSELNWTMTTPPVQNESWTTRKIAALRLQPKKRLFSTFNWPWVHLTPLRRSLRLILLGSEFSNLFYIKINELFEMVYSKCCSSFGKVSVDKESAYPSESSIHQQEKTKSQERKLEYPNSSLRSEH